MPKTNKLSSSFLNQEQKFMAQIEVSENSELLGEITKNGQFDKLKNINILLIQRGEHAFSAFQSVPIEQNDIIIVQADRKSLENALNIYGKQLHPNFSEETKKLQIDTQ